MKEFKTIRIFSQEWMAENLNVDTYRNGDPILFADSEEKWIEYGEKHKGCWCYFDHNEAGKNEKLYNWYAVNDPRVLAPNGFRVPSKEDWERLFDNLGGEFDSVLPKLFSPDYFGVTEAEVGGYGPVGYFESPDESPEDCMSFFSNLREGIPHYWVYGDHDWSSDDEYAFPFISISFSKFYGLYVRCIKDGIVSTNLDSISEEDRYNDKPDKRQDQFEDFL